MANFSWTYTAITLIHIEEEVKSKCDTELGQGFSDDQAKLRCYLTKAILIQWAVNLKYSLWFYL